MSNPGAAHGHSLDAAKPMPRQVVVPDSDEPHEGPVVVSAVASAVAAVGDVTGITGQGKWQDIFRLISQFGVPNIMLGVFLLLFAAGAVYFRSDLLGVVRDERTQAAFNMSTLEKRHAEERAAQELRHAKQTADQRDDAKEDRRQEWVHMEQLARAVNKAAEAVMVVGDKTTKAVEANGKIMMQAADRNNDIHAAQLEALNKQSKIIEILDKIIVDKKK